jgi:putative N-acetyltransferase (TIGR04045 family)
MEAQEILVHWTLDPGEMRGASDVREEVFCREQGVPREDELDGRDEQALHMVAIEPERRQVIGTLRLLLDGEVAKVGRVAVEREWRRHGIAARMLESAIERARELGCVRALLAAQLQATGVYERAGFLVESEPFEEAGIVHVWMGQQLRTVD